MKCSVIRIAVIGVLVLLLCMGIGLAISVQTVDSANQVFKTEHMWDAKVAIGDRISIGASKNGERHIIPILGGTFKGPRIQGEVMPMGEDWQLVRPDGDLELYARYLYAICDLNAFDLIAACILQQNPVAENGYLIHVYLIAILQKVLSKKTLRAEE